MAAARWPARTLRAALVTAATLTLVALPEAALAAPVVAFTITDPRITESSGLARDPAANLYWTVNDSSSDGVVYGVSTRGKVTGTLHYRADPVDVEAVALSGQRLFVADIGDNRARRDMITVYYFDNPRASGLTVPYRAYDFVYPDGAHDAEALLVGPQDQLYVVSKAARGAIYRAPASPSRTTVNRLTRVASAPGLVTDGMFLPGGRQIALLTYSSAVILDASTYQQVATSSLPAQPQAESMTLSLDGRSLLVGSEGARSKVYAMPVPQAPASPSPSATTDPADEPEEDAATHSRRGTWVALAVAALVAVGAGLVVGLARRRGG